MVLILLKFLKIKPTLKFKIVRVQYSNVVALFSNPTQNILHNRQTLGLWRGAEPDLLHKACELCST